MVGESYGPGELRLLWFLKGHGGSVTRKEGIKPASLYGQIANAMGIETGTVRYCASSLEKKSVVIRTFTRPTKHVFAKGEGMNLLLKLELVDPKMWLPPQPHESLAIVIDRENRDLENRVAHEPVETDVVLALAERVHELQAQIDDLCGRLVKSDERVQELEKEAKERKREPRSHLSQRVRDALPADTWRKLEGR